MTMEYTCTVCGKITPNQQCPDHEPLEPGSHWSRNRRRRAQQQFRVAVLLRDGHRCRRCAKPGPDLRAAHWPVPLRSFDRDDPAAYEPRNGITLCADCDRKMDPYAR
jgi:5-methylcytosine-specific restriction endonuclease McrA